MHPVVIPKAVQRQMLVDMTKPVTTPFAGQLDGLKVMLFANNLDITPSTVYADLVPATFDGYAPQDNTWLPAALQESEEIARIQGETVEFAATGSTTPNIVYGWALVTSGGSPAIRLVKKLENPVNIAGVGDGLFVDPYLPLGQPPE